MSKLLDWLIQTLRLILGIGAAIYLIFYESPEVYYCEWWVCSVQVTFHWFQPALFFVAAYTLCTTFWRLCMSLPRLGIADVERPPPFDQSWQQPWPGHYIHYDFHFN